MPTSACVLLNIDPQITDKVIPRRGEIPRPRMQKVFGPYDVAELEVDFMEELASEVQSKIRPTPRVTQSTTWI